jgi:hypothetical protein
VAKGGGGAVEQIFVELGLDPQKFFSGVDSAVTQGGQKTEAFGKKSSAVMQGIAAAAAVAAAAVVSIFSVKSVKDAIDYTEEYASEVRKLARETGMTTEQSSDMIFAFHHVGLEASDASRSLGILAKKLKGVQDEETGVATGGKSTAAILADIGVIATDSEGNLRPMGDLIPEISDAFASMPDGVEKTGLAMQLFGRSGKDMIPMLNLGSAGMADMAAEAKKLGLELSPENAEMIKQYSYAHRTLTAAVGGLKLVVGIALIPVLTKLANMLSDLQPVIRDKLVKAVDWLGKSFATVGKYMQAVFKTGKAWNDQLSDLPTPVKLILFYYGSLALALKDIGEWLLKAGQQLVEWGRKVADYLPSGKALGEHADTLKRLIPLVADAMAAWIAIMAVGQILGFALAVGKVATSFLTFPVREAWAAGAAVKDFVTNAAGLVSKVVTVTMNVVRSGAELIRSLPWMTQEITQLVKRTGAKWIEDFLPKTQEVTQNVTSVKVTAPTDQVKKSGLDIGLKLALGMAQGFGAAIGSLLVAAAVAALTAVGVSLGWAIVIVLAAAAAIVAVGFVAWLAWHFRDKIGAFFTDTLPNLFKEKIGPSLKAFAESLPGWAGQLAGMVAGALVFAFIGVPLIVITSLVKGFAALAPVVAKGIAGAFTGVAGAIGATLAKVPWAKIGGQFVNLATGKTQLELLGKAFGFLGNMIGKVPWDQIADAVHYFTSGQAAADALSKALDMLADGFRELPGAIAAIPGRIADLIGLFTDFATNVPRLIAQAFGAVVSTVTSTMSTVLGTVTGALGGVISAIISSPVGQAVGAFMGAIWSGFQTGWQRVNELTGGALNDLVSGIAGLPGRIIGFVGSLFSAASDLGGAIFDGIMTGMKAIPEAFGDLAGAIKGIFVAAINGAIGVVNALIPDSIPLGFTVGGRFIGKNIDIPDNPIPLLNFGGGGIVPGATGAPVLAIVHGGEHIEEPGTGAVFNFNMPLSMTGYDLEGMRRLIHQEIDTAFNGAARRAYLAGAPLTGGIG